MSYIEGTNLIQYPAKAVLSWPDVAVGAWILPRYGYPTGIAGYCFVHRVN